MIREAADPALSTRQRGRLVRDLAAREHTGPFGERLVVSRVTIDRWILTWRRGGFDALLPQARNCDPRTSAAVLTWADVDFEAGSVTVRRALQRLKGKGLVMVEPKSRAGRRTIALPASLRRGLQTHRDEQQHEREYAAQAWQEHDLVFAQLDGKPIDPRADWKAWKALLARAEIRDARLHDARHTAATLLLQQGVPARVAMQVLGHSQISLTLGT